MGVTYLHICIFDIAYFCLFAYDLRRRILCMISAINYLIQVVDKQNFKKNKRREGISLMAHFPFLVLIRLGSIHEN